MGRGSRAVGATVVRTERASFSLLIGWAERWGRMLQALGSLEPEARKTTLRLTYMGPLRCVQTGLIG